MCFINSGVDAIAFIHSSARFLLSGECISIILHVSLHEHRMNISDVDGWWACGVGCVRLVLIKSFTIQSFSMNLFPILLSCVSDISTIKGKYSDESI